MLSITWKCFGGQSLPRLSRAVLRTVLPLHPTNAADALAPLCAERVKLTMRYIDRECLPGHLSPTHAGHCTSVVLVYPLD